MSNESENKAASLVAPNGIVSGTSGNDSIDGAYAGDPEGDMVDNGDAIQPGAGPDDDVIDARAGDDTVHAGNGDDTVYAGSGSDSVTGDAGNDVIYGDGNDPDAPDAAREVFQWDLLPDPDDGGEIDHGDVLSGSLQQDTGNVTVTFTVEQESHGVDTQFMAEGEYVDGIVTDGEPVDRHSGLGSTLNGQGNTAAYALDFSDPVENVSFRINDIDGDGLVHVVAYDADGNQIPVTLTGGSKVTLSDEDAVSGDETADSEGGYDSTDSPDYSVLVDIPGPVARLVVEHEQNGPHNSGINITDVYFDAPDPDLGPDGDDTLDGGEGDDLIFGEGGDDLLIGGFGNDTLHGGTGDDTLNGGDGDDSMTGNDGSDLVDGGDGNDTIDTRGTGPLPDRGFPAYGPFPAVPADPDPSDDRDTVDGGAGADVILTGDDADLITGGGGNDTIDAGIDDDTVDGGTGDDLIVGGEGADSIAGGDGADTIYGGLDPAFPDAFNIPDDGSAGPADPDPTNGTDSIDGGAGDDVIFGQDDDDTIAGGDGNDWIDGGIDDDVLLGDAGDDTLEGGQGDDIAFGGTGVDSVSGGAGRDIVFGGLDSDADTVSGGDDRDVLGVMAGDTAIGGEGGDDFDVLIATGLATVTWDSNDPSTESGVVTFYNPDLTVAGTANFSEIEKAAVIDVTGTIDSFSTISGLPGTRAFEGIVEGTDGDDLIDLAYTGDPEGDRIDNDDAVLPGQSGDMDIVIAGDGDDTVMGENDVDEIFGGAGNDLLHGNAAGDALDGGAGDDVLHGDEGGDILDGGSGNDTLSGDNDVAGDSGDLMFGGLGDDSFVKIGQGEQIFGGEDPDGLDNDVLDLTGAAEAVNPGGSLTIEYDPTDPESGIVHFLDSTGTETGITSFSEIETVIPCFTPGTLIATPRGERKVEELQVGDRVITRDNGIQEIRWIGRRDLAGGELSANAKLNPVLIREGALGNGLPERDMLVSPNHRVLIANERSALYFEDSEVLVAAKHLTGMDGVDVVEVPAVSYVHFMFDRHEVVLSDGAWTESFQPGDQTLAGMDDDQREELFALFPALKEHAAGDVYPAARRSLKKHEARLLIH